MSEVSTDFLRAGNPPPIHLFAHLFIHSFDKLFLSAYYLLDTHRGTEDSSEEGWQGSPLTEFTFLGGGHRQQSNNNMTACVTTKSMPRRNLHDMRRGRAIRDMLGLY